MTLATAPRATSTKGKTQCLFLAVINKTVVVDSWAWRDQPIDQVGPFLTSRLHDLWTEVVYCQWQCTLLQTLTMTQPPGSHRPLHGLHLTANKVPHTRSCVGIGHYQRKCSPLHHVEVPTHAGDAGSKFVCTILLILLDSSWICVVIPTFLVHTLSCLGPNTTPTLLAWWVYSITPFCPQHHCRMTIIEVFTTESAAVHDLQRNKWYTSVSGNYMPYLDNYLVKESWFKII